MTWTHMNLSFAQGAKPLNSYIFKYENDFFLDFIPSH